MHTVPRITVEIASSKFCVRFFIIAHGIALSILLITPAPVALLAIGSLIILISLSKVLMKYAYLTSSDAITHIDFAWPYWVLTRNCGEKLVVSLGSNSIVLPFLIILHLRGNTSWQSHYVLLFSGAVSARIERQLRVLLFFYRKSDRLLIF